jgi:hypothetical protein
MVKEHLGHKLVPGGYRIIPDVLISNTLEAPFDHPAA